MTTNQLALSKDEVRLYHEQGWLGPYALISEGEMAGVRQRIDEEILDVGKARGWRRGTIFITGIWTIDAFMSC